MDTELDFISPEFFNLLFFNQKNLIIYPYVDLKHLLPLESFLIGYNVEHLDATALYNLCEIIEYSGEDAYTQTPAFYLITNLNKEDIKKIERIKNLHCIININQIPPKSTLLSGKFVVFNKKNQNFLNVYRVFLLFKREIAGKYYRTYDLNGSSQ